MFILRQISKEGIESNSIIGDSYNFIHKDINYREFCKTFELTFEKSYEEDLKDDNAKTCYAFISNGVFMRPLYKGNSYFIMTEGGKTFSNVSR